MPPVEFEYRSLPAFVDFHRSTARSRLIIGGFGSGKSHALVAEAIAIGLEQPGSEVLVTRKTVPALRDTTEKIFMEQIPTDFWKLCTVARAGGHLERVTFPNGSTYIFRGMDDWRKLRSLNLAFICWDEADETTPEEFAGMSSRLRQTKPTPAAQALGHTHIARRGNILAANPQGHNWLWEKFVRDAEPGTAYWTSTSLQNPFLPLDYLNDLLAMPDPWVRRYVLSSFDEFGGAVYSDWSYESHVVRPYTDLEGRFRYDPAGFFLMGFDPGTSAGNAALWCFYDREKHRLVAVAEYNEKGLAATAHADAWRKIEATHGMRVRTRIADPAAIGTRDRGTNMTLRDQYNRLGYRFQDGPRRVQERLWALGQLIPSRRFVVTTDCPETFDQIQQYRYESLTPNQVERGTEAKPKKSNVDLVDAAQYIASRYIAPPKADAAVNRTEAEQFQWEIQQAIRKTQTANRDGNAQLAHDSGNMRL